MQTVQEALELTYQFDKEDFKDYYTDYATYHHKRSDKRRRSFDLAYIPIYGSLIGIPGLVFVLLSVWLNEPGIALIGLIASAWLWAKVLERLWINWNIRRMRLAEYFRGPLHIRIDAEGVSHRYGRGVWTIRWPYVTDIAVGRKHLLFVLNGNEKEETILLVPRHAFASPSATKAFVERASLFWKEAAQKQVEPSSP